MQGDTPYRRLVASLWVLVRTADTRDASRLRQAAEAFLQALSPVLTADGHAILQERDGSLMLNGKRLLVGVESYAAVAAICGAMVAMGVRELLIDHGIVADELLTLARWAAHLQVPPPGVEPADYLPSLGITSIVATNRGETAPPSGMPTRPPVVASTSQLRSVFVHNKLIAAFAPNELVDGRTARIVVQVVVDRLLQEPTGPAALLLLLQDPEAQAHAVHTAVLGAATGRALGCGDELLGEIACALLLHDVGALVNSIAPPPTPLSGSHWLLAQGDNNLWLRAALVARTFGDDHGARLDDLGSEGSLGAALARLGCRADALLRQGRRPADEVLEILRLEAAAGAFPVELVAAMAGVAAAAR